MGWPKRGTRKLVVEGEHFLWSGSERHLCCVQIFTVGKPGAHHVLYIDPFAWSFDVTPGSVASAIQWARAAGWSAETGPTRAMAFNQQTNAFEWLPDGERCLKQQQAFRWPPSVP